MFEPTTLPMAMSASGPLRESAEHSSPHATFSGTGSCRWLDGREITSNAVWAMVVLGSQPEHCGAQQQHDEAGGEPVAMRLDDTNSSSSMSLAAAVPVLAPARDDGAEQREQTERLESAPRAARSTTKAASVAAMNTGQLRTQHGAAVTIYPFGAVCRSTAARRSIGGIALPMPLPLVKREPPAWAAASNSLSSFRRPASRDEALAVGPARPSIRRLAAPLVPPQYKLEEERTTKEAEWDRRRVAGARLGNTQAAAGPRAAGAHRHAPGDGAGVCVDPASGPESL